MISVCLSLQLIEYRCHTITHTLKNRLQTIKYPKVVAGSTFEKRETSLRVPGCPPSQLQGCGLIHINYHVVVSTLVILPPRSLLDSQNKRFYLTMHSTYFILRFYGLGQTAKDHSDSEKGSPLLPRHGLLFPVSSKGNFICTILQTG